MVDTNRAGKYVEQLSGYKAFIPNPLPLIPKIDVDDEMLQLLSQADRALGRLDGSTDALPNPDLFVFMYVRFIGSFVKSDRRNPGFFDRCSRV